MPNFLSTFRKKELQKQSSVLNLKLHLFSSWALARYGQDGIGNSDDKNGVNDDDSNDDDDDDDSNGDDNDDDDDDDNSNDAETVRQE